LGVGLPNMGVGKGGAHGVVELTSPEPAVLPDESPEESAGGAEVSAGALASDPLPAAVVPLSAGAVESDPLAVALPESVEVAPVGVLLEVAPVSEPSETGSVGVGLPLDWGCAAD
jgi:hypothetical protein